MANQSKVSQDGVALIVEVEGMGDKQAQENQRSTGDGVTSGMYRGTVGGIWDPWEDGRQVQSTGGWGPVWICGVMGSRCNLQKGSMGWGG